jgi:hypothetical protein
MISPRPLNCKLTSVCKNMVRGRGHRGQEKVIGGILSKYITNMKSIILYHKEMLRKKNMCDQNVQKRNAIDTYNN